MKDQFFKGHRSAPKSFNFYSCERKYFPGVWLEGRALGGFTLYRGRALFLVFCSRSFAVVYLLSNSQKQLLHWLKLSNACRCRFGIFPSWGLSQKLARIIGPNKAREVSLTATPLTAEQAERLGLVNYVVEEGQLLKKAREIAEAIIKNNHDLVLRYKSVINDGLKLDLGHALALEKERAHEYYNGMTKEQFKKMQEFIAGRSSKKPAARL